MSERIGTAPAGASYAVRIPVTGCTFIIAYVFVAMMLSMIPGIASVSVLAYGFALFLAGTTARLVWRGMAGMDDGVGASALKWALIVGSISFVCGFIGPIIFTPSANQGPLLGIFITGPLGLIVGGIGGLIAGLRRRKNIA